MIILDYYRIFYYVAQLKSFTKAAQFLNNSQPNLTRCIHLLENDLGCRLFIRSNRGVTLTPEGEKLYRYVSIGYEQFLAGENLIRKEKNLKDGLITIGTSDIALHFLLNYLETFHENYPDIHLQLLNYSTPQAILALENHLVDFSIITTPLQIKNPLQKFSLCSFQESLIGGIKYKDLTQSTNRLETLQSLPFISLVHGTGTRRFHSEFFLKHNLSFQPDMEAATIDQVLPLVSHNLGIAFYPEELTSRALLQNEIIQIPLEESLPKREICLIQNTSRSLSIAAKTFINILLKNKN